MRRELIFPWKIPFAWIAGTDPGYSRNLWWWKGKNSQISSLGAITAFKGPFVLQTLGFLWELSREFWSILNSLPSSLFQPFLSQTLGFIWELSREWLWSQIKSKSQRKTWLKWDFLWNFPIFSQIRNFPAQIWLLSSTRNSWLWNPGNSLAFPWNIHEKLVPDYQ